LSRGPVLVTCVLAFLGGGCGDSEEPSADPAPQGCAAGPATPIGISSLVSTLRRHGFDVVPDEECMSAEDVATLSSDYSEKSQDEVELEDGHVICSVLKEVGEPFRSRTQFDRTKYPEDDETYVSIHNVMCAIYPATEPARARRQIVRLERALGEFTRRCRVVSYQARRVACTPRPS
jgi:hypothetical protein